MWSNTDLTQKMKCGEHVPQTQLPDNKCVAHLLHLGLLDLLEGQSDVLCLQFGSLLLLQTHTHTGQSMQTPAVTQHRARHLPDSSNMSSSFVSLKQPTLLCLLDVK